MMNARAAERNPRIPDRTEVTLFVLKCRSASYRFSSSYKFMVSFRSTGAPRERTISVEPAAALLLPPTVLLRRGPES